MVDAPPDPVDTTRMAPFVAGIVAGGAALLYWITSSERNANAEAKAQQLCAGCVRAAEEGRLGDIVQYVDQPCVACLDAVEKHSSHPINKLSTIGALPAQGVDANDVPTYNCYHRDDPMQVYRSPAPIDCSSTFDGKGISPADAAPIAEQLRKDREMIRIKGNRSPMNGILAGI
jgi:hypothetical protein